LGIESAREKFVHVCVGGGVRVCLWFFTLHYWPSLASISKLWGTVADLKALVKYFLLYINAHVSNDQR